MKSKVNFFLKDFTDGYRRTVAQKKSDGIMKNIEGKMPLTFPLYVKLCKKSLFVCDTDRSIMSSYVHLFTTLCWNLFCRSINVKCLRTSNFRWEEDSLIIDLSLQKGKLMLKFIKHVDYLFLTDFKYNI